jgi:hypothetical protein
MRRLASSLSVQHSRGLYAKKRWHADIGTHRHRHNLILAYK